MTVDPLPSRALSPVAPVDTTWDAFAAVWVPMQDGLLRVALLIARDRAEAEDAVSDAMAASYAPWRAGRIEHLAAYARTAVVNRLVGRSRREAVADRFRRTRSGDDRGSREMDEVVADRELLRRALLQLPPRQRAVVALRFYAGLSVADTATTLGCSEGTIKSQTHDALALLRDRLGRSEESLGE